MFTDNTCQHKLNLQKYFFKLCIIFIVITTFGCVGATFVDYQLEIPTPSGTTNVIEKKVWLKKVEILDDKFSLKISAPVDYNPYLANNIKTKEYLKSEGDLYQLLYVDRILFEESFTDSLIEYLRLGRYFKEVNRFPDEFKEDGMGFNKQGKMYEWINPPSDIPKEGDVILKFQFYRFRQNRKVQPAFIPLAIFTLTMYTWCGGPIVTDVSEFFGRVIIEDHNGAVIAQESWKKKDKNYISIWSSDAASHRFVEAKTLIIKEILDEAIVKIYQ